MGFRIFHMTILSKSYYKHIFQLIYAKTKLPNVIIIISNILPTKCMHIVV